MQGEDEFGANEEPAAQGQEGKDDDDRDKDGRNLVDQPLDRRLVGLGVFDHANDAGQGRPLADGSGADGQETAAVDRCAADPFSRPLGDRGGFASEHRFVNRPFAVFDDAVNGNPLAGFDQNQVADLQGTGRNFTLDAVSQQAGCIRLQRKEFAQRPARPAARPGFEPFAGADKGDEHGAGFEEVMGVGTEETEQGEDRITPGGRDAEGDEDIHVGAAVV